jgi:tetratricopeptide (TPR) repeat protein
VKRGKPKTEYPVEILTPRQDAQRVKQELAEIRELARRSSPPVRTQLPSLESTDSALMDALRELGVYRTASAHVAVAAEYRRLGVMDQALEHYEAARLVDRTFAAAYDGLARVWRDTRRPDLALGEAVRAVHYAPRSPETLNTLGTVLLALGNVAEASKAFAKALALDPTARYAQRNAELAARLKWMPDSPDDSPEPGHQP